MKHLTYGLVVTILAMGGLGLSAHAQSEMPAPGSVERASFALAVVEREPSEPLRDLSNDQRQIYFFSELRDLEGTWVVHRWEWNGRVMAEVPFEINGPRWRVFSSKQLEPTWLGDWTVSVVTDSGEVLTQESFSYTESAAPPAAPASAN